MAITPKFTNAQIERMLQSRLALIEDAVVMRLARVGEQFINNARDRGSYKDRTANLRNSVGYVILKNGQQLQEGGFGGGVGASTGRKVLNEAAARYPKGYVLLVVAGMEYAAAVEAKGYDVLSGSAPDAVAALKTAMNALTRKIAKLP